MSAVVLVNEHGVWWECPGCDQPHRVTLAGMDGPEWGFNGNVDKPTITPSVLTRGTHTCHCFIREGRIEFLSDCSHALAGQTVEMLALPAYLGGEAS